MILGHMHMLLEMCTINIHSNPNIQKSKRYVPSCIFISPKPYRKIKYHAAKNIHPMTDNHSVPGGLQLVYITIR